MSKNHPHLRLVAEEKPIEEDNVRHAQLHSAFDVPITPAWTAGALQAVNLIEAMQEEYSMEASTLDSRWRPGRHQDDVVGGFLGKAQAEGSEAVHGFTSMLSFALTNALDPRGTGEMLYTDFLRVMAQMPPAQAHAKWGELIGDI